MSQDYTSLFESRPRKRGRLRDFDPPGTFEPIVNIWSNDFIFQEREIDWNAALLQFHKKVTQD